MCTVELQNGEFYRGHLESAEETMNCYLTEVTRTARNGQVSKMDQVYIRGSYVKMFVLPEMLTDSPIFGKVQKMRVEKPGKMLGRGRGRKKKSIPIGGPSQAPFAK